MKLDFSQEKVLEIKKYDGTDLRVKPRRIELKDQKAHRKRMRDIQNRHKQFEVVERLRLELSILPEGQERIKKEQELKKIQETALEPEDYLRAVLGEIVHDFKPEDFDGFDDAELTAVMNALQSLRDTRTEEEKKTP